MHRWRKSVKILPTSTLVSSEHLRTLLLWRVMQFGLKPLAADFWRAMPHHEIVIQTWGQRVLDCSYPSEERYLILEGLEAVRIK